MGEYNLIDEKWLPTVEGSKSLKDIFSDGSISGLSGNPVRKICHLKLLLAIAQAACTPENKYDWKDTGISGMAEKCLQYLDKWRNKFYLYGDEPFLQMPAVKKAEKKPLSAIDYETAYGNTTVFFSSQKQKEYSDAEKTLLLLQQAGFAFGGKKTDNNVNLSENSGYLKSKSGKPGPFVGTGGYLHSFMSGRSLLETVWLNMFTEETVSDMPVFESGLGRPPWEKMPEGEDCQRARELKSSFIGRLIPLCRFLLIEGNDIHYTEGISYPDHSEGGIDISVTLYNVKKDVKALWASPDKKPWRSLTAILSFLGSKTHSCLQIENCFLRARAVCEDIKIWSGGIKVSSNAGEQYATGTDDYVESNAAFRGIDLGKTWYEKFKSEMDIMDRIAYILRKSVKSYIKDMKSADISTTALFSFWELCERDYDKLIKPCNSKEILSIRKIFIKNAFNVYDAVCPKDTAKQMNAWEKHRPKFNRDQKEKEKTDARAAAK